MFPNKLSRNFDAKISLSLWKKNFAKLFCFHSSHMRKSKKKSFLLPVFESIKICVYNEISVNISFLYKIKLHKIWLQKFLIIIDVENCACKSTLEAFLYKNFSFKTLMALCLYNFLIGFIKMRRDGYGFI